jgi:3-hydroxymyristoyl/3-hydroxydecanoyl-(acyl carrier protein) dehydratase
LIPLPAVVGRGQDGPSLHFDLDIGADCPAFEGHFPAAAILPGIVQVEWAARLAAGDRLPERFTGVSALKFQAAIQPGTRLRLHLETDLARGHVQFRYQAGDTLYSSGRIEFEVA